MGVGRFSAICARASRKTGKESRTNVKSAYMATMACSREWNRPARNEALPSHVHNQNSTTAYVTVRARRYFNG